MPLAVRSSTQRQIQKDLPPDGLRHNIHPGYHRQRTGRSCRGLPEDGRRPSLCPHAVETSHFGGLLCVSVHVIYTVNLYCSVLILAFLMFARVQDVQDVSYSGYLFAEDGMKSTGSSAICQCIYPSKSGLTWTSVFHIQHILVGFILSGLVILVCYCIIISSLS
ncbi:hypothetical protein GOODEAATRI_027546 [Goodea atripinnis]|uniref:Uncharacterized protein n=1 Tax=Goodea atripinnis TaxID=208336 RepID=A0ABV0NE37_9TELE